MTYIIDLEHLWDTQSHHPLSFPQPSQFGVETQQGVSVIMVVRDDASKLSKVLARVFSDRYVREVIIVNVGRSLALEKELSALSQQYAKCHVVVGRAQQGLAHLYNVGAQYASGKFLLFLSPGYLLPPNAISTLLSAGLHKPSPWVVGVGDKVDPSQITFSWHTLFRNRWLRKRALSTLTLPEVSLPGGGLHAPHVGAHCLLVPAKTFIELKGMDRKCFHGAFHLDICLRTHLAGGGVYAPSNFELIRQDTRKSPWRQRVLQKWQSLRGWCHFYMKYALVK